MAKGTQWKTIVGTTFTGIYLTGIRFGTDDVLRLSAERMALIARGYFKTGGPSDDKWKGLHPFTIESQSHTNPLLRSGDLMNSIEVIQTRARTYYVVAGALYAAIHEYGATIPITDRSRVLLHMLGEVYDDTLHPKSKTNTLQIPERSFMRAAARQLQRELPTIAGDFGKWIKVRGV